ncbi:MAG TPA: GNAT family N-acetyltransferase [Solirubrobacterales bacterium]|nr:GNAT family N-acetyltransferase [Solirubrobacterales bacterium]
MIPLKLPNNINVDKGGLWIRRAGKADLPIVLRLLAEMHKEEPPDARDQAVTQAFQEILKRPDRRALLVAVTDNEIVGTLDLLVVPNLSHGGQPWAMIENVVVDQSHRRKGIGGLLLETATELAESAGCYKLQLVSHAKRDAAHALYRHAAFDAPVSGYRRYLKED